MTGFTVVAFKQAHLLVSKFSMKSSLQQKIALHPTYEIAQMILKVPIACPKERKNRGNVTRRFIIWNARVLRRENEIASSLFQTDNGRTFALVNLYRCIFYFVDGNGAF